MFMPSVRVAPGFSGKPAPHRGDADGEIENALKVGEEHWATHCWDRGGGRQAARLLLPAPCIRLARAAIDGDGDLLVSISLEAAARGLPSAQNTTTAQQDQASPPLATRQLRPGAGRCAATARSCNDASMHAAPVVTLALALDGDRLLGQQLSGGLERGGSEASPPESNDYRQSQQPAGS